MASSHTLNALHNKVRPTGTRKNKREKQPATQYNKDNRNITYPQITVEYTTEKKKHQPNVTQRMKIQAQQRPTRRRIKTTKFTIHKPYKAKAGDSEFYILRSRFHYF
jgi:hypothetical protein